MNVLADSQSGIELSTNESINSCNKRIHITYRFVLNVVAEKKFNLGYIPTKEMIGAMLNKALACVKPEKHCHLCEVCIKREC